MRKGMVTVTMRQPTELKVIEGNPGHRPLPNSPKFPPLLDSCPRGMPKAGRDMWRRVVDALDSSTILQASDYNALVALCDVWSTYRAAMMDVRKRGPVVAGARWPTVTTSRRSWRPNAARRRSATANPPL